MCAISNLLSEGNITGLDNNGKSRILLAAAKLFKNKGYAATSLREIATACGIKAGSIYYHFESKDALLAEVLHIGVIRVFEQVKIATNELFNGDDAYALFYAGVYAHLTTLHESIDLSSANIRVFGQAPAEVKQKHIPLRKSYEEFWLSLFKHCQEIGAIDEKTNLVLDNLLLFGTMNSTLEWFPIKDLSIQDLSKHITEKFLNTKQTK